MEKSLEQLKQERHLLWITLSNCHTALTMANESVIPANVKRFVEMALAEAKYALDATSPQEPDDISSTTPSTDAYLQRLSKPIEMPE